MSAEISVDPTEAVAEAERQLRAEAETILDFAGLLLSVGVNDTAADAVEEARTQWLRLVRDPELLERLAADPGHSEVARLLLQRLEGSELVMNPPLAMMAQVKSSAGCLRLGLVEPVTTFSVMPVSGAELVESRLQAHTAGRRYMEQHGGHFACTGTGFEVAQRAEGKTERGRVHGAHAVRLTGRDA